MSEIFNSVVEEIQKTEKRRRKMKRRKIGEEGEIILELEISLLV